MRPSPLRVWVMLVQLALTCTAPLSNGWSVGGGPLLPVYPVYAVPGNGKVTVQFPAENQHHYDIYWGVAPGVTTSSPNKITYAQSSIDLFARVPVTGLTNNTPYYFMVVNLDASNNASGPSVEVTATPQGGIVPVPPTGVHAVAYQGYADVFWDVSPTAETYNVYWRPTLPGVTKANGTKVADVGSGARISALTAGQCHFFVVTSLNGPAESAVSLEVCVTPF